MILITEKKLNHDIQKIYTTWCPTCKKTVKYAVVSSVYCTKCSSELPPFSALHIFDREISTTNRIEYHFGIDMQ